MLSLSKFFQPGTEYFYSFPAGEDSLFFNQVPAWKEELVAARPLVCAGDRVKAIVFAATTEPGTWRLLERLALPMISSEHIITLPEHITTQVTGKRRNKLVKKALREVATPGRLIMSQPFLDPDVASLYQINPELSVWCNDKKNLPAYIPEEHLPQRYGTFPDGESFFQHAEFLLPCVVKVSSSSSGDGVRICKTAAAIDAAKRKFRKISGTIIIEECIDFLHNIGIQFGIPYDSSRPIEIIGVNEQMTTPAGEYIGAIVDESRQIPFIERINAFIAEHILPNIRARGWHGIGGLDVLIGENGRFYFIDCNFRMTAITPYLCLLKNGLIRQPIATFTGSFAGTESDFMERILPLSDRQNPEQLMQIITLNRHKEAYNFNAALYFPDRTQLPRMAAELLAHGVDSSVLRRFQRSGHA